MLALPHDQYHGQYLPELSMAPLTIMIFSPVLCMGLAFSSNDPVS